MKKAAPAICLITVLSGCNYLVKPPKQNLFFSSAQITQVINKMTEVMVTDVTNPPLAARFFSYATLAAYEVISQNDKAYKSMNGIINEYPKLQKPVNISGYSTGLSALLAMMETAKKMQPSGKFIDSFEVHFLDSCKREGLSAEVVSKSLLYAAEISKAMLAYAKTDRYNRISNYIRYTPRHSKASWYPTPPGYFAPVEPYFNTVRPFTLDSCTQFKPPPPISFSIEKALPFLN